MSKEPILTSQQKAILRNALVDAIIAKREDIADNEGKENSSIYLRSCRQRIEEYRELHSFLTGEALA